MSVRAIALASKSFDKLDLQTEIQMVIFTIIVISILLLVLFFAVTIAGGRAHDRQNERRDRDR
ncbi:putative membrane protein [Sphingobium vermicomposti]|uniref:Putative membrane protein n=1 Tax=Sphingobium vermicomposti TaxID=529005 RepID=A0A846M478_9SPHN|nr:putative membrane protein [Sphingobium vermicomposti]